MVNVRIAHWGAIHLRWPYSRQVLIVVLSLGCPTISDPQAMLQQVEVTYKQFYYYK